jgi:hypothetical protein
VGQTLVDTRSRIGGRDHVRRGGLPDGCRREAKKGLTYRSATATKFLNGKKLLGPLGGPSDGAIAVFPNTPPGNYAYTVACNSVALKVRYVIDNFVWGQSTCSNPNAFGITHSVQGAAQTITIHLSPY